MKIVGLTGGMGVGKSTVAKLFEDFGFPVFNSDTRAKELMVENDELKRNIISLLGQEAYEGDTLNRKYIAKKIFTDKELLKKQNLLVHTALQQDFQLWKSKQNALFGIKEAAILFESGSYKDCDFTIAVTSPDSLRMQRILSRDHLSETEVKERIQHQWPQSKIVKLSTFHINNDSDYENLKNQVIQTVNILKSKCKQTS